MEILEIDPMVRFNALANSMWGSETIERALENPKSDVTGEMFDRVEAELSKVEAKAWRDWGGFGTWSRSLPFDELSAVIVFTYSIMARLYANRSKLN